MRAIRTNGNCAIVLVGIGADIMGSPNFQSRFRLISNDHGRAQSNLLADRRCNTAHAAETCAKHISVLQRGGRKPTTVATVGHRRPCGTIELALPAYPDLPPG